MAVRDAIKKKEILLLPSRDYFFAYKRGYPTRMKRAAIVSHNAE